MKRSDKNGPLSRRSRSNSLVARLIQEKKDDVRSILEASILNIYGNFDQDIRRQKGARLLARDRQRLQSPGSAKFVMID